MYTTLRGLIVHATSVLATTHTGVPFLTGVAGSTWGVQSLLTGQGQRVGARGSKPVGLGPGGQTQPSMPRVLLTSRLLYRWVRFVARSGGVLGVFWCVLVL